MNPGGGEAALYLSQPDYLAQSIGVLEGRQHQAGSAHFDRSVGIRTGCSDQVVLAGIFERLLINTGLKAAGVEYFDGIHPGADLELGRQLPVPKTHDNEGMGNADE